MDTPSREKTCYSGKWIPPREITLFREMDTSPREITYYSGKWIHLQGKKHVIQGNGYTSKGKNILLRDGYTSMGKIMLFREMDTPSMGNNIFREMDTPSREKTCYSGKWIHFQGKKHVIQGNGYTPREITCYSGKWIHLQEKIILHIKIFVTLFTGGHS